MIKISSLISLRPCECCYIRAARRPLYDYTRGRHGVVLGGGEGGRCLCARLSVLRVSVLCRCVA